MVTRICEKRPKELLIDSLEVQAFKEKVKVILVTMSILNLLRRQGHTICAAKDHIHMK